MTFATLSYQTSTGNKRKYQSSSIKQGSLSCCPSRTMPDGPLSTDSPNVFVKHRQPYDAFPVNSTMNHILSAVLARAGIASDGKNYGWHTFRRSLATSLLQSEVEISTISEILGHSDPDIAGRYYIKIDARNLKKCMLDLEVKDYVRA